MVRSIIIILALICLPVMASGQGMLWETSDTSGGSLTTYDMSVVATNPTHYWTLADAASSGIAQDFGVGTPNPLTAANVTFSSTALGTDGATSAFFNGTSSRLISSSSASDILGTLTSLSWMTCFTTTQISFGKIFGPENTPDTSAATIYDKPSTYVNNDDGIGLGFFAGSDKAVSSVSPYNNGNTHCAGGVWTSGSGILTSVIDGATIGSISTGAPSALSATYWYKVGAGTGPNNTWPNGSATTGWGDNMFHYFSGNIAKVALWINTPITVSQLATLETTYVGSITPPSLVPVSQPGGSVNANSLGVCNTANDAAHWTSNKNAIQTAMNTLGANALWVPSGCQIYINPNNGSDHSILFTHSGQSIVCAGDNVAGFYNQSGYIYSGALEILQTTQASTTIKGCVFANTYPATKGYYQTLNTTVNNDSLKWYEMFLLSGNDLVSSFNASNFTFTNNLVTHNWAGIGVQIYRNTNPTFTNNVLVDNSLNNGLQLVNSTGFVGTGNWFRNTDVFFGDAQPPQTPSTGSFTSNTFYCTLGISDATGTCTGANCPGNGILVPQIPATPCGNPTQNFSNYQPLYNCGVNGGCDNGGTNCNLSGLLVQGNTFNGSGMGVYWNASTNVHYTNAGTGNCYQAGAKNWCGAESGSGVDHCPP